MTEVRASRLVFHLNSAVEKLIQMSHQLIDNDTNNRAELYMSLLCKFNVAKQFHLTGRGNFQARSMVSGVRYGKELLAALLVTILRDLLQEIRKCLC